MEQERDDRTRQDLAAMRADARLELDAVIEIRCRRGDDPWDFIPHLPTVDEQVVLGLRADRREASPDHAPLSDFEVLRSIALDHPDLTRTVWRLLDRLPDAG